MRRKYDMEMKAGMFLFLGLVISMVTILMMGGAKSIFEKTYNIYVEVGDANGLAKGAAVRSGGLKIGTVDDITFSENYENVRIKLRLNQDFKQRIREDSVVRFQTQGVLGDKFLEVAGGSADKPFIQDGGTIQAEQGKDLSTVFAEGSSAVQLLKENLANLKVLTSALAKRNQMESIMKDLSETSANLKDITKQFRSSNAMMELGQTMKNLRVVTDKVKNGEGTIGALVTDSSLYEDLKNLIGGANRNSVLKFFVRQAVKSTDEAKEKEASKTDKKAPGTKAPAPK
jgi:phospholipid/cholesterol/gamma-HCH transport system substrate-binding protein